VKPAPFDMMRPASLEEAVRLLADHGASDARVIAGGQSLVPLMNLRLATPSVLIDLNRVAGLSGVAIEGANLRIRAMTRQQELLTDTLVAAHAPLLAAAAAHVGHIQTRSRGTVGGSLAQADPSAELPLAMVALGATLTVSSVRGSREIAAEAFFQDALVADIESDEILTDIRVPVARPAARYAFREFARRHGDFAIVAVAVLFDPPDLRVAIGGLEATPRICLKLMDALRGNGFAPGAVPSVVELELGDAIPNSDLQASGEYRRHLATMLATDCLNEVLSS
jgi:CO/xanthine dehydrogenase FAD-binding subunit